MDPTLSLGSNVDIRNENDAMRKEIEILKSALLERCQASSTDIGDRASSNTQNAHRIGKSL